MAVTTTQTNKPFNPRGNDQSPKGYNRAALYSGKALDFDGVNDSILSNLVLSGNTASLSFYLNWDDLGTDLVQFICEGDTYNDLMIHIGGAAGVDGFRFAMTSGATFDSNGVIQNGYNHYVFTTDGTTASVYVNGNLFNSETINLGSVNITEIGIGNRQLNNTLFLDGQIAGFKIFNTALTAAQVADLYNNPEKVVPTGVDNTALKLWLPMQEGAGTTAYDGSGNGNHGTISGATYVHGIGAPVSQTAVIDWNKGTNLLLNSIDPSAGNWTTYTDTTLTGGQSDAIGGTNGFLFAWSTGAGQRAFYQTHSTDNGTYSLSLYAKAGTHDCFQILFANDGSNYVNFDLTNGTTNVYAGGSSSIEAYGNDGWYKCEYTYPSTQATRVNIWAVDDVNAGRAANITSAGNINMAFPNKSQTAAVGPYIPTFATGQTSPVLLPQGLTSGRDITGVNLFENVRKQGALNLDGNSWAEVHDNASLDVSEITAEGWMYAESITSVNNRIVNKWDAAYPERSFQLYGQNNTINWMLSEGSAAYSITGGTLTQGQWHHVVGTYDGTTQKIYLNGVQVATTALSITLKQSSFKVMLGGYTTGLYSLNPIAQPRIYDRALTAAEVLQNYNSGKNTYK